MSAGWPASKLAGQLRRLGHWPEKQPDDEAGFGQWCEFWRGLGVFTLADQFGDDGSKRGEFDAYLRRVDPDLLAEVEAEIGGKHKPRIGARFADRHPEPPAEVVDLYSRIAASFGIEAEQP